MIADIILLVLAIPAGYLIAWMARDELADGRKWFGALVIICVVLAAIFTYFGFVYIALSLEFIGIVSLISVIKSRDKKWTKKRI